MLAFSSSRNDIIFETTTPCDDICHSPSIKWSISTTAIAVFGDPVIDQIIIPCFILSGCGITYRSIRWTPKLKLNEARNSRIKCIPSSNIEIVLSWVVDIRNTKQKVGVAFHVPLDAYGVVSLVFGPNLTIVC
jgi:hypothetical protein